MQYLQQLFLHLVNYNACKHITKHPSKNTPTSKSVQDAENQKSHECTIAQLLKWKSRAHRHRSCATSLHHRPGNNGSVAQVAGSVISCVFATDENTSMHFPQRCTIVVISWGYGGHY